MGNRLLGSYAEILSFRGVKGFVVAGWLGRLSRSTTGIATVLLVSSVTGSFAVAGAVSAAIVVGSGLAGPLWSRLVDARGQTAVLPIALLAFLSSAVGFASVVLAEGPRWSWFLCAFLVGFTSLDFGSLARARWSAALESPAHRHHALALESVNDELVFVVGPPVVVLLASVAAPVAGFATGVAVTLAGGVALLLQTTTSPRVAPRERSRRRGGPVPAGVLAVLPVYLGVGLVFASIDVSSVAVGRELGSTPVTGLVVACLAVGSVVAGIVFGPLSAAWSPRRRVLVSTAAYAVVIPALLLPREAIGLSIAVFAAGLVTTPVLISGMSFIESRTDRGRLTEALSWPSIGTSAGITVGSALTGLTIDVLGAFPGLLIAAAGALVVGAAGLTCWLIAMRRVPS